MFEEKIEIYKDAINIELKKFLSEFNNKDCSVVCDAAFYSMIGGGKFLRPILTLCVCDMFGENFKKALPFACAVEFIHVGSLVHDDLPCMDDDLIRRGKASCHAKYGEAGAVLVGDFLFCAAFEILSYGKKYGLQEKEILDAVSFLSKMFGTKGIIAGQDMDIFTEKEKLTKEKIELIAKYKTASLFRAACYLGAIAADADLFKIKILDEYATYFGIAFQILDDVLDYLKGEGNKKQDFVNFATFYGKEKAIELSKTYLENALNCLFKLNSNEFLVKFTKNIFCDITTILN